MRSKYIVTSLVRSNLRKYNRYDTELEEVDVLPIKYFFCNGTLDISETGYKVAFDRDNQEALLRSRTERERYFGRWLFDGSMEDKCMLRVSREEKMGLYNGL